MRGYRGGYLPNERRAIERGLRDGQVPAVVSTNALELGIDIGGLEASVLVGYPGTIASSWQQMGRAGRRRGESLSLFVASSDPLDQFIVSHPDYFFERSPESGLVNPDNLLVLMDHLKCAAFELPFRDGEPFGVGRRWTRCWTTSDEERVLHHAGNRWHWMSRDVSRGVGEPAQGCAGELRHHRHDRSPAAGHRRGGPLLGAHADPRGGDLPAR